MFRHFRIDPLLSHVVKEIRNFPDFCDDAFFATLPKPEILEGYLCFFEVDCGDGATPKNYAHELRSRGLAPHVHAQIQVNVDDREFERKHPNVTHWTDGEGTVHSYLFGSSYVNKRWLAGVPIVFRRPLFPLMLGPTGDQGTVQAARKVFTGHLSGAFEHKGIVFSGATPETEVLVEELIQNGDFYHFLHCTQTGLERRRLLGSQFLAICRDHYAALRKGGYSNFFVLTKGDEEVSSDLSNVFVAQAYVRDNLLVACLHEFQEAHVSRGEDRYRFFSPR